MEQFEEYAAIPEPVRELVANKIHLLDEYILMQTKAEEYTALIRNTSTGDVRKIVVYKNEDVWQVYDGTDSWDYHVTNEYYTYSNIGYGAALDLPVIPGLIAHCSAITTCALMFAIVYKGVLFPCLLGRQRRGL